MLAFILFGASSGKNKFFILFIFLAMIVFLSMADGDFILRALNDPRVRGFFNGMVYLVENPSTLLLGFDFTDHGLKTVGFSDNFLLQVVIGGGIPALILFLLMFPIIRDNTKLSDTTYLKGLAAIFFVSVLFTASTQFLYFFFPFVTFYFSAYHAMRFNDLKSTAGANC